MGLIAHSKRDAIIISFADEAERAVNAFFELYAQIEPQTDAEREALDAIARYHQQHVLQGGVVGILSLIEFIRYAQQQGLIKVAAPNDETVRATSLLEEIDGCIYQIRRILHILATTVKPHTYGLQTNLTVTTDGLITGDVDEVPFVFGQMLRQLRSLVAQIKDAAEIAKKDVTALVTRSAEVSELLSPDRLKQQLCVVDRMQPQSFLHPRPVRIALFWLDPIRCKRSTCGLLLP